MFPDLPPARLSACSMFSVVSTPKMVGTPVSRLTDPAPPLGLPGHHVVVAGFAAYDCAQADYGVAASALGKGARDHRQLEGARNPGDGNIGVAHPTAGQRFQCAFQQLLGDNFVKSGNNYAYSKSLPVHVASKLVGHNQHSLIMTGLTQLRGLPSPPAFAGQALTPSQRERVRSQLRESCCDLDDWPGRTPWPRNHDSWGC